MSSESKQRAPDYAEPLIGVRAWRVDINGFLHSTTRSNERWVPGEEKKATCDRLDSSARLNAVGGVGLPDPRRKVIRHKAPQSGCSCGLYAFYDRRSCKEHGDRSSVEDRHITGVVSGWGEKVILCEYGFRAQYMKLEALVLEQETIEVFGFPVYVREAHEKLARRYGVPLLVPAQVKAFSRERGAVFETRSIPRPGALIEKPDAVIEAIRKWREESEHLCRGHRPGTQRGEGGAPAPPEEGGESSSTREAREAGSPEEKEEGEGSGLVR